MDDNIKILGMSIGGFLTLIAIGGIAIGAFLWLGSPYFNEALSTYGFSNMCQRCEWGWVNGEYKYVCDQIPDNTHYVVNGELMFCDKGVKKRIDDTNAWGEARYCAYCAEDETTYRRDIDEKDTVNGCWFGRSDDEFILQPIYDIDGDLIGSERVITGTKDIICRTFTPYTILTKDFNKRDSTQRACSSLDNYKPSSHGVDWYSTGDVVCSKGMKYRCDGDANWESLNQACEVDPENLAEIACQNSVNCKPKCNGDIRLYDGTCQSGECVYGSDERCDYGCSDGECLSEPTTTIITGSTTTISYMTTTTTEGMTTTTTIPSQPPDEPEWWEIWKYDWLGWLFNFKI